MIERNSIKNSRCQKNYYYFLLEQNRWNLYSIPLLLINPVLIAISIAFWCLPWECVTFYPTKRQYFFYLFILNFLFKKKLIGNFSIYLFSSIIIFPSNKMQSHGIYYPSSTRKISPGKISSSKKFKTSSKFWFLMILNY